MLIYIANWPKVRSDVWTSLLKARALENQAFVAGVNRIGVDGNGLEYSGDSVLFDFKGQTLSNIKSNTEQIETIEISLSKLNDFKKKFPAYMDSDNFKLL